MMMLDVYYHLHTLVDSALRQVAVVHTRGSLSGVHDVIQCCDWLMQINITSYRSRGMTYVISHAFGFTLNGCGTQLAIQNRFCSTVSHIVQRGINSQLGDCKSGVQKPRSAYVNQGVQAVVYTDHHHHVFSSCSLQLYLWLWLRLWLWLWFEMLGFLFLVYQLVRWFCRLKSMFFIWLLKTKF